MSPDRQSSVVQALFQAGEYYHDKGDAQSAETQLKQAIELDSAHVPSRLLLSKVLVEAGRLDEGLGELEAAYQTDRDAAREPLVRLLLVKGKDLETTGEEEKALSTYEHVRQLVSDDPVAPKRISDIWRSRAECALEADDLDRAVQAYSQAGLPDEVERVKELRRDRVIEQQANAARAHEQSEDWEQACACYERLIQDDPENEEWPSALDKAGIEANLAKCYEEGARAVARSEWKQAADSFLEVLIVRAEYKDAARRLVQVVERNTPPEERDGHESPVTDDPDPESSPRNKREEPKYVGQLHAAWVVVCGTLLSSLAALAVVYFLTIPLVSSVTLPQEAPPNELLSADGWTTIVVERFLGFLGQERRISSAPVTVFVALLLTALGGWFAGRRFGLSVGPEGTSQYRLEQVKMDSTGTFRSSIFGQVERIKTPSETEKALLPSDAPLIGSAPAISHEAQPSNGSAPRREAAFSSLSNAELKKNALKLALDVRSFGQKWKLMAGEAASYPPPTNDDSVQLYVDLIDKLGGFQEDFDKTYRWKVAETCELILERVPKAQQMGGEIGKAIEADDVEDAASRLEQMAAHL